MQGSISLRDYQQLAVESVLRQWRSTYGWKPCVLSISTGGGKSVVIAEIARRVSPAPVLLLQPSKEILEQNYEKLLKVGFPESDLRVCSASAGSWKIGGQITLATIGTIAKWAEHCKHFEYVIIDESDTVPIDRSNSQYLKFLNELNPKGIVGLTATPFRNVIYSGGMFEEPNIYCRPLTRIHTNIVKEKDSENKTFKYGEWFWSGGIIFKCEMKYLQSKGHLSPTNYYIAETDWSFVRDSIGRVDYETTQMTKWMDIEANTSRFTQAVQWCIDHGYRTIVFSPTVAMNERLADIISVLQTKSGLLSAVETMDSEHDSKKSREAKMERFRSGETQFLVNVGMVGRGVDVPAVDAVIMCRPTKSLALYMQYVGRCLRIDPMNPDKVATILDLSGNVERFGPVEEVMLGLAKIKGKTKQAITIVPGAPGTGSPRKVWERVG